MKTKIVKTIIIELTEAEAFWLKHTMQNPLHNEPIGEERDIDKKIRESLFSVLQDVVG